MLGRAMEKLPSAKVARRRETKPVSHAVVHCSIRTRIPDHPALLRFLNPGRKLFGYPAAKFKRGNRFYESLVHPQDRVRFQSPRASSARGATTRLNYRLRYADGRYRRLHELVRCVPDIAGQPEQQMVCVVESAGLRLSKELQTRAARALDRMTASRGKVRKRRRAEEASNASADFTGSLIHCMQDGFSVLDTNGVALEANPAFCQMTGFSRAELVGVGPPHPYWPPEEYERIQMMLSQARSGGLADFELNFRRRNGERFPVIFSPFAVKNRSGDTISFAATVKDVTPRKHSEMLLTVQRDLAVGLSQAVSSREACECLLAAAVRLPWFDCGGVYELDAEQGDIHLVAHQGLSQEFVNRAAHHRAGTPQARLVAKGELLYAIRSMLPEPLAGNLRSEELEAVGVVPLRVGKRVFGSLNVSSRRHPRIETEAQLALETLTAQAEAVLKRVSAEESLRRAHEELEARVRERTAELEAAHLRLATLLQTAPAGIVIHSADGRILRSNDAAQDMLGLTADEARGKPLDDPSWRFLHEDCTPMLPSEYPVAQVLATQRGLRGRICGIQSGRLPEPLWLYVNADPFFDEEGKIVEVVVSFMDITGRKTTEAALHAERERLRLALAAGNQSIYDFNVQTGECRVSPDYARMLGFDPETFHETLSDRLARVHPDDRAKVDQAFHDYLAGRSPEYAVEFRERTRDGSWIWVLSRGKIVERTSAGTPLRVAGTRTDITERKRLEMELRWLNESLEQQVAHRTEALRMSEERFRTLAEAAFEGVLVSREGQILDCNEQLATILACPREQLIGRMVQDFVAPEMRERVVQAVMTGAVTHFEHEVIRADGAWCIVETHGRSPDGPAGIRLTAVRDVTDERRAAAERERHAAELAQAQRLAELSEISAGIVHQLSHPISSISANLASVHTAMKGCQAQECALSVVLKDIEDDMRRAREIVNRLRALAHPERRSQQRTSPEALVAGVLRLVQAEALQRRVRLVSSPVAPLPMIDVDVVQMSQALLILVRNGIQAAAGQPDGEGEVQLVLSAANGSVEIAVIDSGAGIAAEDMPRLFDPFFSRKAGGMGVGLRLARRIITAHGGALEGGNHTRGGACFRIKLPSVGHAS